MGLSRSEDGGMKILPLSSLALTLVLLACHQPAIVVEDPPPPRAHPSRIVLTPEGEPGTALEVTGQVFAPDGVTPARGVTVYAYQTGVDGRYARKPGDPPRIRGWMTTDATGSYAFRTVRPGSYPGEKIPAHIHFQLWGGGWPVQYNEDVNFADDELLTEREREHSRSLGRFGPITTPVRGDDGVLRATHDLRLKPKADVLEDNIQHGVKDEPKRG
jgi:protocatechuate 3,4-dioxygenase beta subunit